MFFDILRYRVRTSSAAQRWIPRSSRRRPQGALPTAAAVAAPEASTVATTDPPRRQSADRSATTYLTASRSRTTCFSACGRPSRVDVYRHGWRPRQRRGYDTSCVDRDAWHFDHLRHTSHTHTPSTNSKTV